MNWLFAFCACYKRRNCMILLIIIMRWNVLYFITNLKKYGRNYSNICARTHISNFFPMEFFIEKFCIWMRFFLKLVFNGTLTLNHHWYASFCCCEATDWVGKNRPNILKGCQIANLLNSAVDLLYPYCSEGMGEQLYPILKCVWSLFQSNVGLLCICRLKKVTWQTVSNVVNVINTLCFVCDEIPRPSIWLSTCMSS